MHAVARPFRFDIDPSIARWNRAFLVRPERAVVEVGDEVLDARFGPWRLVTRLANVSRAEVTGPYRWWRVAGPARYSLADGGITMATSARCGVCIEFVQPVAGLVPLPWPRHPSLTVTVAEPDELIELLGR